MNTRIASAALIAAFALVLTGCSGADESPTVAEATPSSQASTPDAGNQAEETGSTDDGTTDDGTTDGGTSEGDVAGLPQRPQPDDCVDITVPEDGVYTIYDAGTAVVTVENGRLVVGEITAADGWTSRVDDQDDDEVQIDFRRSATEVLDLEVEIDDGRVEAQICADDD